MTRSPQEPTALAERAVEALDELYRASGQIHAGGLQPDLDRFERARIGAGMALRLAPAAATELEVERLARAIVTHRPGITHPNRACGRKCAPAIAAEYARSEGSDAEVQP